MGTSGGSPFFSFIATYSIKNIHLPNFFNSPTEDMPYSSNPYTSQVKTPLFTIYSISFLLTNHSRKSIFNHLQINAFTASKNTTIVQFVFRRNCDLPLLFSATCFK